MPIRLVQSSFMMRHMRHIFQRMMSAQSIYECEGAKTCAIEIRSFSKNAGFTGVRLGFTVVPKDLKRQDVSLHGMWARRHGTKFNGAPYIIQRAGEAVYSEAGKAAVKRAGRLLYEKCIRRFNQGLSGSRLYGIWRCKCTVYLVEDTG